MGNDSFFLEKSYSFYRNGNFQESESYASLYLESNPQDMRARELLCDCFFKTQQYERFLEEVPKVIEKKAYEKNIGLLKKTVAVIKKMHSVVAEREKEWNKISTSHDKLFGFAMDCAVSGEFEKSKRLFEEAAVHVFGSGALAEDLVEAHDVIINAFSGISSGENVLPRNKKVKKVMVSGTGWSGSGAIYDYFMEFLRVKAVPGETKYIESSKSLKKINNALSNDEQLKREILSFYYYALLGYGYFTQEEDVNIFRFALRKIHGKGSFEYAKLVKVWCVFAANLYSSGLESRKKRFFDMATFTINNFAIGPEASEDYVYLLDNVVHVQNIACIEFVEDASIFCSFRDPRSNYVALVREKSHYGDSVSDFVVKAQSTFKKCRKSIGYAQRKISGSLDRELEVVQFENFVLSESYRDSLAIGLGLDLNARDKFSRFRPWESMRNVVLHQEHSDQGEIKLIEKELGEYCYEPCVRPLLEEVSRKGEQCVK